MSCTNCENNNKYCNSTNNIYAWHFCQKYINNLQDCGYYIDNKKINLFENQLKKQCNNTVDSERDDIKNSNRFYFSSHNDYIKYNKGVSNSYYN